MPMSSMNSRSSAMKPQMMKKSIPEKKIKKSYGGGILDTVSSFFKGSTKKEDSQGMDFMMDD